ncbi:MAG TPA: flagellar export chaperone FliS [Terracidiphilus sp.]|jgi:flagellar protein FliS|nr:flagellar export chaperone FliS [Terracidiphilus sp.]
MSSYREHALEGASAVDLVVALYDGILRFLHAAVEAVDRGDVTGRRIAVRRALDILIHLQARLRMDVGGKPAQALSEFYASIFAQVLQASQGASRAKFEHAIACVRNVREAWKVVAADIPHDLQHAAISAGKISAARIESDPDQPIRWTA